MEVFITVIIVVFLFFWVLSRLLPFLIAFWVKKKMGQFGHFGNSTPNDPEAERRREGDVFINNPGSKEKVVDKNVGEYVDFEEKK